MNGPNHFLDSAERISMSLATGAIWNDERRMCNWMGPTVRNASASSTDAPVWIALGPDIYAGSAGIALLLGEMFGVIKTPILRETCLGGLRRSLEYLRQKPGSYPLLGAFSGVLGVLYAAERVQLILGTSELGQDTAVVAEMLLGALEQPRLLDLTSGSAGAIPLLVALSELSGSSEFFDLAVRCGVELCEAASWSGSTCAWGPQPASGLPFNTPLGGLAHGASGFALGLLQLFHRTGDQDLVRTARGSFAYEDTLFEEVEQNWLDVRFPFDLNDGKKTGSFPVAWCHGAGGIALARIRAASLDPDRADYYMSYGERALSSTIDAVNNFSELPNFDSTLCHGICGLSEILLILSELLERPSLQNIPRDVAARQLDRHNRSGHWPGGLGALNDIPSLMLGTAGIAHHFLRLGAVSVPPVLLLDGRGIEKCS
jgi:lantibiotic modifying enzyme